MKKRRKNYTVLNQQTATQQSGASAGILTSPTTLSPNAFQFSPNVVVTLPEPEPWMNPKAGPNKVAKLERLDSEHVRIVRNCLSEGFDKAHQLEAEAYKLKTLASQCSY